MLKIIGNITKAMIPMFAEIEHPDTACMFAEEMKRFTPVLPVNRNFMPARVLRCLTTQCSRRRLNVTSEANEPVS